MKLQDQINEIKSQLVYNRKRVMKRAWYLYRNNEFKTLGEAISYVCAEVRIYRAEKRQRLEQLEYALNIEKKQAWAVQPGPEFYMKRDWNNNTNNIKTA